MTTPRYRKIGWSAFGKVRPFSCVLCGDWAGSDLICPSDECLRNLVVVLTAVQQGLDGKVDTPSPDGVD